MTVKIGVILSGCGFMDGAEIQESVMTLYAIEQEGATYDCYAPDIKQHHVVNHLKGEESAGESRNVLEEAARIARGNIKPLSAFDPASVDGLILPGGFGVAKNLSDFAFKGADLAVLDDLESAVSGVRSAGKPVGALCIAPAVMAKLVGDDLRLTIGSDPGTAGALEALGARHEGTTFGEIVVDEAKKVVTAPCYMLDSSVSHVAVEARKVVKALIGLMD